MKLNRKKRTTIITVILLTACVLVFLVAVYAFFLEKGTGQIEKQQPAVSEDNMENISQNIIQNVTQTDGLQEAAEKETALLSELPPADVEETSPQEDRAWEEEMGQILAQMSLEDKICQMFYITPEALTDVQLVTQAGKVTKKSLKKYPVGGLILFAKNIEDPDQIKEMTKNIKLSVSENGNLPVFIGIDEEGGRVARIGNNENFLVERVGSMSSIAESGDLYEAYNAGSTIAGYLSEYGFNMDFAPDADVITVSENAVIGDRSFGSDPELVAAFTESYLRGLQENGIIGCAKHYPGHGGTREDSHEGAAVTERSWEEIEASELLPFKRIINNGAAFIMASHIEVPELTGDDTPTTLSDVLIREKLRDELGFEGVIITDSMAMGAITDNYTSDAAAVKAVEAGVDMILMPQDFKSAYNGLLEAVRNGEISEEHIDESVRRIINAKRELIHAEDTQYPHQ